MNFTSQEKHKLVGRLQRVRQSLTPEGSAATLYNVSMLSAMMDLVEGRSRPSPQQAAAAASSQSFLRNSGQ